MRKRTGLANKFRPTRGTYDTRNADNYGGWENGRQIRSERVNGRVLTYNHHKGEWR